LSLLDQKTDAPPKLFIVKVVFDEQIVVGPERDGVVPMVSLLSSTSYSAVPVPFLLISIT
jgi:hypothetical protein